ncbi:MAG TPA: radical SAM protein [Acidobacteriaceae bacterium]
MKPLPGNVAEYHVENFGCRASRSDGESIAATLREHGMEAAEDPSAARVVVVNTCSVTAEADRQARAYVRRLRRQNPAARILVTGCYAQRAPQELAALPEVDAVVGNSHKALVADMALRLAAASPAPPGYAHSSIPPDAHSLSPLDAQSSFVSLATILHDDRFAHSELATLPFAADARQTRPNLKVQDGCGNRCSFCIIPTTRGHSRSIPLGDCLASVRRFVDRGGIELVLSGINLGRWGRDLQTPQRFQDLVAAILTETALPRLRLSSIEPMDWSADLLALYREFATGPHPRLARHTHLPLQSGSDAILRRMHRRYRPWHYAERLAKIRELLPAAAIGADVMIGFPGETDSLFHESYRFIAAQPFTYLHLFPFSARPATPAWELHRQNPVPPRAVQDRMAALRSLIAGKSRSFREPFVGLSLSAVTVEPGTDPGTTDAVTDNFLKLTLDTAIPPNRLIEARVSGLTQEGLCGTHGNSNCSAEAASGQGLPASKFDER